MRHVWRACGLAALCLMGAPTWVSAQRGGEPSLVDRWVVLRYRGAQLLPDSSMSGATSGTVARNGQPPRIETTRRGLERDTLWAVHFGADASLPGLVVGSRTTLTGPTGTITPVVARVVARRAFRAPRSPGSAFRPDSSWRYGWAYLVVMPHLTQTPVARFRGWLLLDTSDAARVR